MKSVKHFLATNHDGCEKLKALFDNQPIVGASKPMKSCPFVLPFVTIINLVLNPDLTPNRIFWGASHPLRDKEQKQIKDHKFTKTPQMEQK